jgi:hypothetical protein
VRGHRTHDFNGPARHRIRVGVASPTFGVAAGSFQVLASFTRTALSNAKH